MAKKINKPMRINQKFKEDMENILQKRVSLGLMNIKDARLPKATELLTRTQGYKMSLNELGTKRERKRNEK